MSTPRPRLRWSSSYVISMVVFCWVPPRRYTLATLDLGRGWRISSPFVTFIYLMSACEARTASGPSSWCDTPTMNLRRTKVKMLSGMGK